MGSNPSPRTCPEEQRDECHVRPEGLNQGAYATAVQIPLQVFYRRSLFYRRSRRSLHVFEAPCEQTTFLVKISQHNEGESPQETQHTHPTYPPTSDIHARPTFSRTRRIKVYQKYSLCYSAYYRVAGSARTHRMTKPNLSGGVKGIDDGTHRKMGRNGIGTNTESFVIGRRGQSVEEEPNQPRYPLCKRVAGRPSTGPREIGVREVGASRKRP